jgi:tetratricopeptide (TPR) repeat protein
MPRLHHRHVWTSLVVASGLVVFVWAIQAQQKAQKAPPPPATHHPLPRGQEREDARFDAIFSTQDIDTRIGLAERFLDDYPSDTRRALVFELLVNGYSEKQDWAHFYATTDRALVSYPKDVEVLTLAGWVIPHEFDPNAPDAAAKLEKAEKYEKRAIELIPSMPTPANLSPDKFAAAKSATLAQAHSGLGLVYFRKGSWAAAVTELQAATQSGARADQSDLYALAVGLEKLNRYAEAALQYDRCILTPGPLQNACKEAAGKARSQITRPD